MKIRSPLRKLGAGLAGTALLAGLLAFALIRPRASEPGSDALVAGAGVVALALIMGSWIAAGRELASRERVERGLKKLAMVDELTGLFNRRGFVEHAGGVLDLAGRIGRPAVLFFVDVDGLKAINDRHGHAAGDLTLAGAARILQLTFRSSDVIARIGGDEFAVLALVDARDGGEGILPRLRKNIDFWNGRWGQPFGVSLSMGTVAIDASVDRLEEILARADKDLYEKKGFRQIVTA
jgi:diguanylate cyclase (GGDEF)-like protein